MKYTHNCKYCGKEFESSRSHSLYCSDLCSKKWRYHNKPKTYSGICEHCGDSYEAKKPNTRFCSIKCSNLSRATEVEKTCPTCSSTWVVPYYNRDKSEYCSYSCATKAKWKNWEEQGIKDVIGNKISEARKEGYASGRTKRRFGKNAPGWKGGMTKVSQNVRSSTNYTQWRMAVFERDKFTCCSCGASGVYLNADHIKPFHLILKENDIKTTKQAIKCEELWDINNGRTLCVPCHKKTDTYGGRGRSKK